MLAALGAGRAASLDTVASGVAKDPALLYDVEGRALAAEGVAAECPMFVYWPGCLSESSALGERRSLPPAESGSSARVLRQQNLRCCCCAMICRIALAHNER